MKRDKQKISFIIVFSLFINLILGNVYAENINLSTKKQNSRATINPVVTPIPEIEIDKVVNNVKDFDIQNPEYDLRLTAKLKDGVKVGKPLDIALILDTSGSMNERITNIHETSDIGAREPDIKGEYYVDFYGDGIDYQRVDYRPDLGVWEADGKYIKFLMGGYGQEEDYVISSGATIKVELRDFYEKTNVDGKDIYTPWIRYCIKIGDFIQRVSAHYNTVTKEISWYYFEGNNMKYVTPEQGATGENGKYEFYELKEEPLKKMDILKKEANLFIDNVAKKSVNSTIDLIAFNSNVVNVTGGFNSLNSQENVQEIKDKVNSLIPASATSTDLALEEALKSMRTLGSNNDRKRVVVLITDGEPARGVIEPEELIQNALGYTDILKSPEVGAYIYSLGIFSGQELENLQAQQFMKDAATQEDTTSNPSKKYFFNCMGSSSLSGVFDQIIGEIGVNLDNSKVKDYIDPKFVITEESKALLISQGAEISSETINGVTYEVVTWNTDIKPNTEGFTGTITIKPKDSSVHGNALPTNIEGVSAIYDSTGSNIGSFPLPSVDIVNLADELHQEKKSVKVDELNNLDRTYRITLTAWTTLQKLEVIDPNTGLTDYGASGVKNATVRDYLDPRFEPTPDFLESIKSNPEVQAIQDTSGNWCIEWSNQFIPYMTVDNSTVAKWSKDIEVKAKDGFIGGNDISTNISPISGIYIDENQLIEFDKPTVNVPVKLNIKNTESTIFYGENVPTVGVEETMFNPSTNDCFLGQETTGSFVYTWFREDGSTLIGNISELEQVIPKNTEIYKLNVEFIPSKPGDLSQGLGGGAKVEATSAIGNYTVNIVKGQITATKKVKSNEIWFPNGDPIFTFELERLDDKDNVVEKIYDVVRFEKNDNIYNDEYASKSVTFQGLKKGKYRLSESQGLRYRFENNDINNLKPCKGQKHGEELIFYVGYEDINNSKTNLNNNDGEGIFINKKVSDKYFTHTDVIKNTIDIKK